MSHVDASSSLRSCCYDSEKGGKRHDHRVGCGGCWYAFRKRALCTYFAKEPCVCFTQKKEPCVYIPQKRPVHIFRKRALCISSAKEPCVYIPQKSPVYTFCKRALCIHSAKERALCTKEPCICTSLFTSKYQQLPAQLLAREVKGVCIYSAKEPCLHIPQKSPVYIFHKRALYTQKSPIYACLFSHENTSSSLRSCWRGMWRLCVGWRFEGTIPDALHTLHLFGV